MRTTFITGSILLAACASAFAGGTLDATDVLAASRTADGALGSNTSYLPSLSGSGRYVAFATLAPNLLPGVTPNGKLQIVRKDLKTGKVVVVSTTAAGALANADCSTPIINKNGKRVVFLSTAGNLDGAGNAKYQVFWKDLSSGEVRRVTSDLFGGAANQSCYYASMSDDGRFVAFVTEATNMPDSIASRMFGYRYDTKHDTTERVTYGLDGADPTGDCTDGRLSGDGRFFAFTAHGSLGFEGESVMGTNIFLRDLKKGVTTILAPGKNGAAANGSSAVPFPSRNGRFIAFRTSSTNICDDSALPYNSVMVLDRKHGKIKRHAVTIESPMSSVGMPSLSANGRTILVQISGVILPNMQIVNWCTLIDRKTGKNRLLSVWNDNVSGEDQIYAPEMSANGKRIAFSSHAATLRDGKTDDEQVFVTKS